jgi:hypothetical protein
MFGKIRKPARQQKHQSFECLKNFAAVSMAAATVHIFKYPNPTRQLTTDDNMDGLTLATPRRSRAPERGHFRSLPATSRHARSVAINGSRRCSTFTNGLLATHYDICGKIFVASEHRAQLQLDH